MPVTRAPRMLVGDRERDRARARADVEDAWTVESREEREAALDDDLRLRPRDQRPPVDRQRQPAEAPFAEDVLERLARGAAGDERRRRARAASASTAGPARRCELAAGQPEDVRDDPLRVDARDLLGDG